MMRALVHVFGPDFVLKTVPHPNTQIVTSMPASPMRWVCQRKSIAMRASCRTWRIAVQQDSRAVVRLQQRSRGIAEYRRETISRIVSALY